MVTTRNTRADVVAAAGRLFAEKGYHGTSMRDLGRELGLLGSSLYSHVDSKQDLLVEVVEEGARLFQEAAARAVSDGEADGGRRLRALIRGHIEVVLDHQDVARTFLNEARMLDQSHRSRVIAARDRYESVFRDTIRAGREDGSFRRDVDPKLDAIFVLSVLNALDRWYRPEGELGRDQLVERLWRFISAALSRERQSGTPGTERP